MSAGELPVRHAWRDAVTDHEDPRVDAYALAVVAALHRHMAGDGVCWVGLRRLAEVARCSVNTVRARLDLLADLGLLVVDRDGRARTIYRAQLPAPAAGPVVEAADPTFRTGPEGPVDNLVAPAGAVSPGERAVSPGGPGCVTRRHTYTKNTGRNPAAVAASVVGRPPPGRPPGPVPALVERPDGTLWVASAAGGAR